MWFTADFVDEHESLTQLLRAATTWPGSRWCLAPAAEAADTVLTTRAGAREAQHAHGLKRVKTGKGFLGAITLDLNRFPRGAKTQKQCTLDMLKVA